MVQLSTTIQVIQKKIAIRFFISFTRYLLAPKKICDHEPPLIDLPLACRDFQTLAITIRRFFLSDILVCSLNSRLGCHCLQRSFDTCAVNCVRERALVVNIGARRPFINHNSHLLPTGRTRAQSASAPSMFTHRNLPLD